MTYSEYSHLAAPLGAFEARADTPDELEAALGGAVASGTPALLDVSLDA